MLHKPFKDFPDLLRVSADNDWRRLWSAGGRGLLLVPFLGFGRRGGIGGRPPIQTFMHGLITSKNLSCCPKK
jgi:hypothetical protein